MSAHEITPPDNNPKSVFGVKKPPLHLIPPAAKVELAAAMHHGAVKYGPYNWRENSVAVSIYVGAAERHLDAFWDGEDYSPEWISHHLGNVMACCAIMLDALHTGNLIDDRPQAGNVAALHRDYEHRQSQDEITQSWVEPERNEAMMEAHATGGYVLDRRELSNGDKVLFYADKEGVLKGTVLNVGVAAVWIDRDDRCGTEWVDRNRIVASVSPFETKVDGNGSQQEEKNVRPRVMTAGGHAF